LQITTVQIHPDPQPWPLPGEGEKILADVIWGKEKRGNVKEKEIKRGN
jgi:hypothetical protein